METFFPSVKRGYPEAPQKADGHIVMVVGAWFSILALLLPCYVTSVKSFTHSGFQGFNYNTKDGPFML